MTVIKLLNNNREHILKIAAKYGASNIRIFGSVARGEENPSSDLDVLVDLAPDRSLFDLGGLLYELEELLKIDVDVVTPESLHWCIRDKILEEAVELK